MGTRTPERAGNPPGPHLPNLDVMRQLQSLTPAVPVLPSMIPVGAAPTCDQDGVCDPIGGGPPPPPPPPPPPNDPNYATSRTEPHNATGEPHITLRSRNFNSSASL